MSQIMHFRQSRRFNGMALFAAMLLCSVTAGFVQRACWISYLSRSGYGLGDLIVPLSEWLNYHSTPVGLLLDILIAGPLFVLVVWFWFVRSRSTGVPNQSVQRAGASRSAQETNRASSAAGSRR